MLVPSLALGLMLPLVGYFAYSLQQQNVALEDITSVRNSALNMANEEILGIGKIHIQAYRYLSWADHADPKLLQQVLVEFKNIANTTGSHIKKFAAQENLTPIEQKHIQKLQVDFDKYISLTTEALKLSEIDAAIAAQSMQTADDFFRAMQKQVEELASYERGLIHEIATESQASYHRNMVVGGLMTLITLLGVGFLGFQIARSITKPLLAVTNAAGELAEGHLISLRPLPETDEVGILNNALSRTAQNLRDLIGQINGVARQVSMASNEIASGNQDLSSRTESTATGLQETAQIVDTLGTSVATTTANALEASRRGTEASELAAASQKEVQFIVESMSAINTSSRRISEITALIDGIAFQTNILALNAAVEAARAGEHGRGFAVVASEVRSLAQRSSTAAKDIAILIRTASSDVEKGSLLVSSVGEKMSVLAQSIQGLAGSVNSIASSAQAQNQDLQKVNTAVSSIENSTQQNAALVEELSASAMGLTQQTQLLIKTVNHFDLVDKPGTTSSTEFLTAKNPMSTPIKLQLTH